MSLRAPIVGYSVAVGEFSDARGARRLADQIITRMSGTWVSVVPVRTSGRLIHRVLVGLEEDAHDAEMLRETMGESLGDAPDGWIVRDAGRAFLISESASRVEADRTAADANSLGVPAYVLRLPTPEGTARFRTYAGAFGDEAEAKYLGGVLRQRGFTAQLAERAGTFAHRGEGHRRPEVPPLR